MVKCVINNRTCKPIQIAIKIIPASEEYATTDVFGQPKSYTGKFTPVLVIILSITGLIIFPYAEITNENPSRPTPADNAEINAFLALTPNARLIINIITGTKTAAGNVSKNAFNAPKNTDI